MIKVKHLSIKILNMAIHRTKLGGGGQAGRDRTKINIQYSILTSVHKVVAAFLFEIGITYLIYAAFAHFSEKFYCICRHILIVTSTSENTTVVFILLRAAMMNQ